VAGVHDGTDPCRAPLADADVRTLILLLVRSAPVSQLAKTLRDQSSFGCSTYSLRPLRTCACESTIEVVARLELTIASQRRHRRR
jgi:hypothetical protein